MKHSLKRFASLSLAVVLTMQVFSVAPLQVAAVDWEYRSSIKALPMKRSHLKTQMMQMSTPL